MRITIICLLIALGMFNSCIEPYRVEIDSSKEYLVVEGLLTNEPGKHYVQLNLSMPFYDTRAFTNSSVRGASVTIVDDLGNEEPLQEVSIGKYATTTPDYKGEIGRSYQLKITTKEGKHYESVAEELKAVAPIEEVYYEYKEAAQANPAGLYVYVRVEDQPKERNFYKWNFIGHQRMTLLFADTSDLDRGEITYSCITSERCTGCVLIASDEYFNGNKFEQLITIVPYNQTEKYVIKLDQFSISQGVYEFWEAVKRQAQNTGGVFDVPPTGIKGNVYNIDNKEEVVLGYFGLSSRVSRIATIRRDNLPFSPPLSGPNPKACKKEDIRECLKPSAGPPCDTPPPLYWFE